MPVLRFEGHSDDTFGEVSHFHDDYDNYASGKPIEYLVECEGVDGGIVVTGQHCPNNSGSWLIGVANHDPDYSDRAMPNWPIQIVPQDGKYGFSPALIIEVPDGVKIKCLQRTDQA